ncbi:Nicotinate dehydrogenase subunit A [bioreactor metagenome]|uniref:Nicotinate dehydrogenase subunit A n=1 Tax=bioreactor metagenome TaxID=1076179 RepID=A0A645CVX9_9ZZZZ
MEVFRLTVNNRIFEVQARPNATLLSVLRDQLDLTGAKCGCGTGDCGACTVLLDGEAVRSCIVPVKNAVGKRITTIEGLARGSELHPIQRAFVECGAIQCGFCTPGMILAAKALLDHNPNPTEDEIRAAIRFNLCRCTGYARIVEAVQFAAELLRKEAERA